MDADKIKMERNKRILMFIDKAFSLQETDEHPFDIDLLEKQAVRYIQLDQLLCKGTKRIRDYKIIIAAACYVQLKQ